MLMIWGVGLGTEIRDVYILGGLVRGDSVTEIGDVNGGGGGSDGGVLGQILGMLHVNS